MLSINTILVFDMNNLLRIKAATQAGKQVPGPLHKIKSGFVLITAIKLANEAFRVVNTVVSQDCPTSLALGITMISLSGSA